MNNKIQMKLRDINIVNRLVAGFVILFSLVLILSVTAYMQSKRLWTTTDELYHHPLQVSGSARDLRFVIMNIDDAIDDLVVFGDGVTPRMTRNIVDSLEAVAYSFFDTIYLGYLGNKADIDDAFNEFKSWKISRDRVLNLYESGNTTDVIKNLEPGGVYWSQYKSVKTKILTLVDFARNRAKLYYNYAIKEKTSLFLRLFLVNGIILIIFIAVGVILIISIRKPISDLTSSTEKFMQGDYSTRAGYNSRNEFGKLSSAFNKMAMVVQSDIRIWENSKLLAEEMMKEQDLKLFGRKTLGVLMELTSCHMGAIYLLNKENTYFEHFESIGFSDQNLRSFSADSMEGEFGPVLAGKKIRVIKDISSDIRYSLEAVSGSYPCKSIITIPILDKGKVIAVISLASLNDISDNSLQLINHNLSAIASLFNRNISLAEIIRITRLLEIQNAELDEKSREMTVQAEELKEYNLELELQKQKLQEATKLKSSFLSNMSHELRTPLNSIIALSGILVKKLNKKVSDEESRYIAIIEKSGRHLLAQVNDILEISKIESGKEQITISEFSLYEMVESIVISLHSQIREKKISVVNRIIPGESNIGNDYTKCHHILQNVINNAVKFTEKGSVEISASFAGAESKIDVKDTGIGIEHDQLELIFDEFRQADEKTSRRYGGTGLGLAIAKKYANMLGGSIEVRSKPGEGSVFSIFIVSRRAGAGNSSLSYFSDNSLQVKKMINPLLYKGKCILVVEDSEAAVVQLSDILQEEGLIPLVARNGQEALEVLKSTTPDGIILDLMMPDTDGFEVLRKIREDFPQKRIPLLILTAKTLTDDDLKLIRGNGIHQFIQKGDINKNSLVRHIMEMLIPEPDAEMSAGQGDQKS